MAEKNKPKTFFKHEIFTSWKQFEDRLHEYEKDVKQVYVRGDCHTLKTSPLEGANKDCVYVNIKMVCKFGPNRHAFKNERVRNTTTFKIDCPSFIYLKLTRDKQCLQITNLSLQHQNHDGSEDFIEILPENRKITDAELKNYVHNHINMGCPKSRIRDELLKEHGIHATAKDIQNIAQKYKNKDEENILYIVKLLKDKYGAHSKVFYQVEKRNEKNIKIFKGLYYSTESMKTTLCAWPEIIFMDGTYNLLKSNLVVVTLSVRDSSGNALIVGVGLLANEDRETLQAFLKEFSNDNENIVHKISTIMTDKDLTERAVIMELFPHVNLLLCEFHVLKIFNRTITTSKMNISKKERDIALNYLDKMTKSNSEEEYNKLYEKFCVNTPATVVTYFNNNWHCIRNEWTRYAMSKNNFGNYTNNTAETINAQLKNEIKPSSSYTDFFEGFFRYLKRKNISVKYTLGLQLYKKPLTGFIVGSVEFNYQQYLTKNAFEKVLQEFNKKSPMEFLETNDTYKSCWIQWGYTTVNCSTNSCECLFFTSHNLPCRHIFAVRKYFGLSLFDEQLCSTRWTKQYNNFHHPVLLSLSSKAQQSMSPVVKTNPQLFTQKISSPNPTNINQRRRLLKSAAEELVHLGSLVTQEKFRNRLDLLHFISSAWKDNKEINITHLSVCNAIATNTSKTSSNDTINSSTISDDSIILPKGIKFQGRPKGATKSTLNYNKKN